MLELHGQWWRLVTATFLHIGIIHIGTNMWCLWNLGLLGEPLLGPFGIVAVYLLTGVAGNLLSSAVNPGCDWGWRLRCCVWDCGRADFAAELAPFAVSAGGVKAIAPQRDLFRRHQSCDWSVHPSVFRRYQDR